MVCVFSKQFVSRSGRKPTSHGALILRCQAGPTEQNSGDPAPSIDANANLPLGPYNRRRFPAIGWFVIGQLAMPGLGFGAVSAAPIAPVGHGWIQWAVDLAVLTGIAVLSGTVAWMFIRHRLKRELEKRQLAEAAQLASEQRFRQLVNQSPVVYELYDREGVQRMVNPAYEELWGIDSKITLNSFNVRTTVQGDSLKTYVDRAYAGEVVDDIPDFYWDAGKEIGQGRARWINFKIYPLFDVQGIVEHIVVLHEDITARKRSLSALEESEEKFRNFAEQSLVGMYLIQDGVFKYVNPKFAAVHGYSVQECLDNLPVLNLIHPGDRAMVEEQLRKRLSGEIPNSHYTFRSLKKDGGILYAEVFGSTTVFEGRPANIGTYLDITEKVEIENNLRQAHKMEAVGTLAGGIAHEFNNVLGIIIGNTELGIDDLPEWNPVRQNLAEIKNACLRAKDMVKQLLNFSRRTDAVMQQVDLAPIIKESLKLMRASIPTTIDIRSRIPESVSPVAADPTQIHQVVFNLCTNAAHAMNDEGGELDIVLETLDLDDQEFHELKPGTYVRLLVQDTGQGIEPDALEKIFDPYFTTKEVGKGSGMGLAVIHGIVKAHNGSISVRSTVGRGSVFEVLLPVVEVEEKDGDLSADSPQPKDCESILFVDDEPMLAEVGSKIFTRLGYRVTSQTDPMKALEAFRSNPYDFDLVISDMTMPKITGDRLADKLMAIRPDIPIILCTGYSERLDKGKALRAGIRMCLDKPLNTEKINRIIRDVLDGRV